MSTADMMRDRLKAGLLASNLLFIIMSYYMVKTASRSIILEAAGSSILPYIWIGSALLMLLLIPLYQWVVAHTSRFALMLATLTASMGALLLFFLRLDDPTVAEAALFYGFSDVMSVVIVEQFWSLTNSEFHTRQARRWYGVISSGGLLGGLLAGVGGAQLIASFGLSTADLLLVSIGLMGLSFLSTAYMIGSKVFHPDVAEPHPDSAASKADKLIRENNYLLLVAAILLLAQLATPFIEYQFMTLVDDKFVDQDQRTVYLSRIFSWISGVALFVNLALTSFVHRHFGAVGGLVVRPLMVMGGSAVFMMLPTVHIGAMLRVLDKALAYSINRASRELLYVPMSPPTVYAAKAWIDMLGFRLFKVFGSGVIILLTTKLDDPFTLTELSVVIMGVCVSWTVAILTIRDRYHTLIGAQERRRATPASGVAANAAQDAAAA